MDQLFIEFSILCFGLWFQLPRRNHREGVSPASTHLLHTSPISCSCSIRLYSPASWLTCQEVTHSAHTGIQTGTFSTYLSWRPCCFATFGLCCKTEIVKYVPGRKILLRASELPSSRLYISLGGKGGMHAFTRGGGWDINPCCCIQNVRGGPALTSLLPICLPGKVDVN